MEKKFATKEDLVAFEERFQSEMSLTQKLLRLEILSSGADIKKGVENALSNFQNKFFSRMDPLLRELEEKREDREIGSNQMKDLREQVNSLGKRTAKLEHLQKTA